jgi:hypothetical protein
MAVWVWCRTRWLNGGRIDCCDGRRHQRKTAGRATKQHGKETRPSGHPYWGGPGSAFRDAVGVAAVTGRGEARRREAALSGAAGRGPGGESQRVYLAVEH